MSKVVTCPVKRFEGTVTLRDPMTLQMVAKWEEVLQIIRAIPNEDARKYDTIEASFYPLVVEMVEAWNLANILPNVTAENFPNASPGTGAASIHALIGWLITECQKVYNGNEDDDPNE